MDYRLTFRNPPNCTVSSCDVFVGIDTNLGDPSFLDIYLEGKADGWIAVGFTETPSMVSEYDIINFSLQLRQLGFDPTFSCNICCMYTQFYSLIF